MACHGKPDQKETQRGGFPHAASSFSAADLVAGTVDLAQVGDTSFGPSALVITDNITIEGSG
jgi:hypothetical protein